MLARTLRGQRKCTFISAAIVGEFYPYYCALYNLPTSNALPSGPAGRSGAHAYIRASGMPFLTRAQGLTLEGEIMEGKLALALPQAKPHKASGPDGFTLPSYRTFAVRLG